MISKVIKIINLHNDLQNKWLKKFIENTVFLTGQIGQIRRFTLLNAAIVYVSFENEVDAERTMCALNGIVCYNRQLSVLLVDPSEIQRTYEASNKYSNKNIRNRKRRNSHFRTVNYDQFTNESHLRYSRNIQLVTELQRGQNNEGFGAISRLKTFLYYCLFLWIVYILFRMYVCYKFIKVVINGWR